MRRLSERQRQILRLTAAGRPYTEIAESLGIGERTVEEAVRRAIEILGAPNRLAAVVKAIKLGEIKLEEIDV